MKPQAFLQMRLDLEDTAEVRLMAHTLGVSDLAVVGSLWAVWKIANRQLSATSNRVDFLYPDNIDHAAKIAGFAAAMAKAKWLVIGDDWVEFPGYNESIGSRAKYEADQSKKTAKARQAPGSVTRPVAGTVERRQTCRRSGPPPQNDAPMEPPNPGNREMVPVSPVTDAATGPATGEELRNKNIELKEEDKDICPETLSASSGPPAPFEKPLLQFPCDGPARSWALTQAQIDDWAGLYPNLDVLGQCRMALAWVQANPGKRKTARGMQTFLVGWLGRATNNPSRPTAPAPKPDPFKQAADRIRADRMAEPAIVKLPTGQIQESAPYGQLIGIGGRSHAS